MPTASEFIPTYSKLSVHAEYHNPSMLNARFLAENGIVPDRWVFADASSGWQFSQVRYQNDFSVSLGTMTLDIEDRRRAVVEDDPTVVDAVCRYLDVVRLVNYRSLAAHLIWERPFKNPAQFLTERFLSAAFKNDDFSYLLMDPRFRFAVSGWNINLWLYAAWLTQPTDETAESLSVSVQATSQVVDNVDAARADAERWPAVQGVIEQVVYDLLWRNDHGSS